jgi:serine protease Do
MLKKLFLSIAMLWMVSHSALAGNPQIVGDSELLADLTEQVGPAVVNIDWENKVKVKNNQGDPFDDFFNFGFNFGRRGNPFNKFYQDGEVPLSGAGSGVIVDAKNGYIITNEHVIHDANKNKINITLLSGKKLTGKVIGTDRKLDIAIIKVNEPGLPEAQLGNSEKLRPGQWVIAIGNPYQFSNTVTFGIISALARNLDALDKNNLIQTDAPINPGNSGGPLINMKGEVIGINVAIDARATGIGFAIPINAVKNIMDDLIKKGKIVRPWVGIYMRNVDKEIADYLNLPIAQGVLVVDVAEDSPAANARLQKYDVIRKIEGQTVKDSKQLADLVAGYPVGKKISVEYWREGKTEKTQIKIGEQP